MVDTFAGRAPEGRVLLHPLLFGVDAPDFVSGHKFSDLNDALGETTQGCKLMNDMPKIALKFSDRERLLSLVGEKGEMCFSVSYDKSSCVSVTDLGTAEVALICGKRAVEFEFGNVNIEVMIFDHKTKERVHLLYRVCGSTVDTHVGVVPAVELAKAMQAAGYSLENAFLPEEFTPEVFRTTYLGQHFRGLKMFDFREIRVADIIN